jgi:DNA-binding NtrC family response regulator
VSEVSPHIQAKLLRVLQERAFERVGSSLTIGVDVRVVATSNRDLPTRSTGAIPGRPVLPAERAADPSAAAARAAGDVRLLAQHFVAGSAAREGRGRWVVGRALDAMAAYAWPGNVRELQNICERAVVISVARGAGRVEASLVEPWLRGGVGDARRRPDEPSRGSGRAGGRRPFEGARSSRRW